MAAGSAPEAAAARIRPATPADAAAITVANAAMALETENLQLDLGVLSAGVAALLADPSKGRYYLAEEEAGAVVGQLMITFEWSDWRNAQVWWVQSVYVAPAHRRRGIYSELYRHVREAARAAGACGVRLYADNGNAPAHAVYTRLGMISHYRVFEDIF